MESSIIKLKWAQNCNKDVGAILSLLGKYSTPQRVGKIGRGYWDRGSFEEEYKVKKLG